MSNNQQYLWKQGMSFEATCTIPVSSSIPDLNGVTIESSVRSSNGQVFVLNVSIPDLEKTKFILSMIDTTAWSIGIAEWDVKITKSGKVMYTDTVEFNVVNRITQ
jgi:hypothetical protein